MDITTPSWIPMEEKPLDERVISLEDETETQSLYPSPLDKVLSRERSRIVKGRMIELEESIRYTLNLTELDALNALLGRAWYKKFSLPGLEFADDASSYANEKMLDVKERMQLILDASNQFTDVRKVLHIALMPYFLTTESETLAVYGEVLGGKNNFPNNFFRYDQGRKAGIVTRHMCSDLMDLSPIEAVEQTKKIDFESHGLGGMLSIYFRSSVNEAMKNAYPPSKYPQAYIHKLNGQHTGLPVAGGLTHLVGSLDALFGQSNPKSQGGA